MESALELQRNKKITVLQAVSMLVSTMIMKTSGGLWKSPVMSATVW